jgi:shikimate dehydrogenase
MNKKLLPKIETREFWDAVTGETSVYCVLGNPVAHSMSPPMHNTAFRQCGLNAIYVPFQVNNLADAVSGLSALGIKGASVTIPFKEDIMELVDEVDNTAKKIGAVNTLLFNTEGTLGTNTDWTGALRWLETLLPIEGRTFAVLGAGGAARAVLFGITDKGGNAIVVNRSEEKGRALAREFNTPFLAFSEVHRLKGDCLVNTTPIGMHPNENEMPVPTDVLGRFKAVADVIYNPLKTMLLKRAEETGCRIATGFEMFVYQGVKQFELWTGLEAPVQAMKDVVYHRLVNA